MSESFPQFPVKEDSLDNLIVKSIQDDDPNNRPKSSDFVGNRRRGISSNVHLLETGFLSDLTLRVGVEGEEVKVHRLFLQMVSPVFYRIFVKYPKLEKITISDGDISTIKIFLEYVYSGSCSKVLQMENALKLLQIGTKFEMEDLTEICINILKKKLTDKNVFKLLEQGGQLRNEELKDSCLTFISKNARRMMERQDFEELSLESVIEIVQRDDLELYSEIQLFNAIMRWGKAECKRKGMDETNLKSVLKELIPLIRFGLMDKEEFTMTVWTKGILNSDEAQTVRFLYDIPYEKRASLEETGPYKFNSKPREYYKPKVFFVDRTINYMGYSDSDSFSVSVSDSDPLSDSLSETRLQTKNERLIVKVNRKISLIGIQFSLSLLADFLWISKLQAFKRFNETCWDLMELKIIVKQAFGTEEILVQEKVKPFLPQNKILFGRAIELEAQRKYSFEVWISGRVICGNVVYMDEDFTFSAIMGCAEECRGNFFEFVFSFSRSETDEMPISQGILSKLLFHL